MSKYKIDWMKKAPKPELPSVRITPVSMRLNSAAAAALGKVDKVMLGFDESKTIIGIKKHSGDSIAYKTKETQKPVGLTVNCKAFLSEAIEDGILKIEKSAVYPVEVDAKDGCAYIVLDKSE